LNHEGGDNHDLKYALQAKKWCARTTNSKQGKCLATRTRQPWPIKLFKKLRKGNGQNNPWKKQWKL
jgi:hypothetical protein